MFRPGPPRVALAQILPLAEAATFTAGCLVLRSTWIDPKRVEFALILAVVVLSIALLIGLTPPDLVGDTGCLDPAGLWPQPR